MAAQFNVQGAGAVIVADADGKEIARGKVGNPASLIAFLEEALKKYEPPKAWLDSIPAAFEKAQAEDKLVLVLFDDESEDSAKLEEALTAKELTALRRKFVCVKLTFDKESADAKELKVSEPRTIVILNPKAKEAKRVLTRSEKVKGEDVVRFLEAAFKRLEEWEKRKASPFSQEK